MSDYDHDSDRRECRRCGALLSMWFCDACGSDSFETVTDAYVAELASPWRGLETASRSPRPPAPEFPVAA
jgi:hypothetical protein